MRFVCPSSQISICLMSSLSLIKQIHQLLESHIQLPRDISCQDPLPTRISCSKTRLSHNHNDEIEFSSSLIFFHGRRHSDSYLRTSNWGLNNQCPRVYHCSGGSSSIIETIMPNLVLAELFHYGQRFEVSEGK